MTERTARNVLIGFVDKDMNSMDVMNFKFSDETPEYFNFIYTDGNGKQLGDNLYSVKKDYSSVMVSNGVEGKLLEQIKLPDNVKKFASRTWVKDETDVTYDVTLYFNSNNSGYISYNEGTQARLHQIFTKFTLNGNEGRFSFTQRDDSEQGSGSGKFVLKGDTLEFTFDGFKPIQLR
jgi:hypothetical protein